MNPVLPNFLGIFKSVLMVSILFFGGFTADGQNHLLPEEQNMIFDPNIKSVLFFIEGLPISTPIIPISRRGSQGAQLVLMFDEIEADAKYYYYSITHYNQDWTPSSLSELEYLDGFNESTIDNYQYSRNTRVSYTHYQLRLPNDDVGFRVSGNYVIEVYEDEDERRPIFSRRFMVSEASGVSIEARIKPSWGDEQRRNYQEIDFKVKHEGFEIRNPEREINVSVIQNRRWDSLIGGVRPMFVRKDVLDFEMRNELIFPSGKDYRYLDLRTTRNKNDKIQGMYFNEEGIEVELVKERTRAFDVYLELDDLNGGYIVDNFDRLYPLVSSDYIEVLFSLSKPQPMEGKTLYLYGALSDFRLSEENKMVYNPAVKAYVGKLLLKQGYYDYVFAYSEEDSKKVKWTETEGDSRDTENDYTILIYYSPFGERYDRLIATTTINSLRF